MKQLCKRIFSMSLGLLMLFSLTLPQALASDYSCGPNLEWSIDDTTLTISGTGAMNDYQPGDAPWSPLLVQTVVLEEGITSLGANAFGWCEDLTTITLPASLQSIGANALTGTNLRTVTVAPGNQSFSVKGGVLFNKNKSVLLYYPTKKKGSKYTVPASVKTIAANAISGDEGLGGQNPYLKTLVLPKKLKTVSANAFAWSTVAVYQFQAGAPKLGKGCFAGNFATIRCPKKQQKAWTKAIKSVQSKYKKKNAPVFPDLTLKAS